MLSVTSVFSCCMRYPLATRNHSLISSQRFYVTYICDEGSIVTIIQGTKNELLVQQSSRSYSSSSCRLIVPSTNPNFFLALKAIRTSSFITVFTFQLNLGDYTSRQCQIVLLVCFSIGVIFALPHVLYLMINIKEMPSTGHGKIFNFKF